MKKALEAGIKHCSLFEKYLTHLPEMVDFYYKQKIILQVMLAALDAEPEKPEPKKAVNIPEPEKPEPQGSVVDWDEVDWDELESLIYNYSCIPDGPWQPMSDYLKNNRDQWLHTKPIVNELVEALKDLSDSIDDGTTLSGQRLENVDKIIAKYTRR